MKKYIYIYIYIPTYTSIKNDRISRHICLDCRRSSYIYLYIYLLILPYTLFPKTLQRWRFGLDIGSVFLFVHNSKLFQRK